MSIGKWIKKQVDEFKQDMKNQNDPKYLKKKLEVEKLKAQIDEQKSKRYKAKVKNQRKIIIGMGEEK